MFLFEISAATRKLPSPTSDPIHLVTQFYLPKSTERLAEVQEALRRNAANPYLESILLLNERIYTEEELGVSAPKIKQYLLPRRVKFSDLFSTRLPGYTVVANADIFFDETIQNVRTSDIHCTKKMYSLLRYEFTTPNLAECKLFGPRSDSADTWIVHANHSLPLPLFNFELGRPGCDNKLNYLFRLLGFEVYNDPNFVRSYHVHREETRAYALPAVPPPYMLSIPAGLTTYKNDSIADIAQMFATYDMEIGNAFLAEYVSNQLRRGKPFVVPRVAGVENNAAVQYHATKKLLAKSAVDVLKTNAGVLVEAEADLTCFSEWYFKAFGMSEMYASWESWSHYTRHIEDSQAYLQNVFPKTQITTGVFDIFHFVSKGNPWTQALRGKKILIVSPFAETMLAQPQAYPVDLFPGCTFTALLPPLTQGDEKNKGFKKEFKKFCARVNECEFDVALCSCGGYGNPICAYIFSLGKSAIYVGGVLQMYFGVYGARWIKERKDAMTLYMTKDWTRPNQRPKGFERIENGCYW
jgi:hypothetical protein